MELYYLIFINSLKSSILISFFSDDAWFAALYFGNHNMWFAPAAAVAGSTVGTGTNLAIGSYMAWRRDNWLALSEKVYLRLSRYTQYMVYLLMLPLSDVPGLGIFWGLYVVVIGFFRAPLVKSLLLIVIGRIIYYDCYLFK